MLIPWMLMLFTQGYAFHVGLKDVLVSFIVDVTPDLFPPTRLSIYLCLNKDDMIRLSRELSRNQLAHEIQDNTNKFAERLDDSYEHRNLQILDLSCDYAREMLRLANSSGMFVAPVKWLLLLDPRAEDNITSLKQSTDKIIQLFEDLPVYPDSDVVLATRMQDNFIKLKSIYRPSPYRSIILEDRGNWTSLEGLTMSNMYAASHRRRNLQLTPLKSCLVMTDPNTINHLTDYQDKHIDAVTKANYPWMLHIVNRINATITFNITDTWGYMDANGSWSGMIGMLQRREIDVGGTGTFFIPQRIGVVQYIQLYTHTGSRFVFRQPLLSTVSNIFALPFQRSVWIAIGAFLMIVLSMLYVSTKWEFYRGASPATSEYWSQMNPAKPTLSDNLLVIMGAVAQQGYSYEPYRVPTRIVTLMLLIASLSLYVSYTANIVALLQSTTDSIKTISDLMKSPLKLGAQDVIYNRYYFKSFSDPTRRAIVDQKIEPKGHKSSWMNIQEGVRRVKNELFAFHGEVGIVYNLMQETYQEDEKCGITEIDFLKVLDPMMIIQIRSPYFEIIKNSALLLRESGLKFREENHLYTAKPKCHGQTSFINIGLTECYFALVTMGYGLLITIIVFVGESLWYKWHTMRNPLNVENIDIFPPKES